MCRPEAGTASGPTGDLLDRINRSFGSMDKFKERFTAAALGVFGSGYAWLLEDEQRILRITGLSNQVREAGGVGVGWERGREDSSNGNVLVFRTCPFPSPSPSGVPPEQADVPHPGPGRVGACLLPETQEQACGLCGELVEGGVLAGGGGTQQVLAGPTA